MKVERLEGKREHERIRRTEVRKKRKEKKKRYQCDVLID